MLVLALPVALVVVLLFWIRVGVVLRTVAKLPNLTAIPGALPDGVAWPTLSVVVACRNEAAAVRAALSSMLAQDYPSLEIVAVDDRSEDATGAILDELAVQHPAMRIVHVATLPDGWLGKTHALSRGAEVATGELLLFTDADVVFAPDMLRRTVAWMRRDGLGHAVAACHFIAPGLVERAFVSLFTVLLLFHLKVHQLGRKGSSAYVGAGTFNLVQRDAYRSIGGHGRLRLEVVDDVKLGLLLRRSGVRQGCADSGGLVRVRWQPGFLATTGGLIKNFFAAAEYRWRDLIPTIFGVPLVAALAPVCLVLPVSTTIRLLAAMAFALPAALLGASARRIAGGRGYEGLLLPVVGLTLAVVAFLSGLVTTLRGGVVWRGTVYPLRELRAHGVHEAELPTDRAPGQI